MVVVVALIKLTISIMDVWGFSSPFFLIYKQIDVILFYSTYLLLEEISYIQIQSTIIAKLL